jgi:hypothetical protein
MTSGRLHSRATVDSASYTRWFIAVRPPGRTRFGRPTVRSWTFFCFAALSASRAIGDDSQHERAFYLAKESHPLAGNNILAKKYASRFPGKVTLDEFKALRTTLGIPYPRSTSDRPGNSTCELSRCTRVRAGGFMVLSGESSGCHGE